MMTLTHSKLLTALLDGESTRTDLRERSGVYGSTCTHALAVMLREGWITDEKVDGMKTRIVEITHDGKRALQRYQRGEVDGPKVAPITINRMIGTYTPRSVYTRNNGNVHIQSFGYGC
jgi:DNA-binding MarR family transcriptional regulator